jgi:cytochrome c-type protein NapB
MTTKALSSALALVWLAACATSSPPAAMPAAGLGLEKGPVLATPVPPELSVNDSAPGAAPLPRASYPGVSPVIPHGIDGMVPITPRENACLACHGTATKEKGAPTPIPASHYVDLRNAPERAGAKVSDTRYVCVSCHVEATSRKPLVGNDFKP